MCTDMLLQQFGSSWATISDTCFQSPNFFKTVRNVWSAPPPPKYKFIFLENDLQLCVLHQVRCCVPGREFSVGRFNLSKNSLHVQILNYDINCQSVYDFFPKSGYLQLNPRLNKFLGLLMVFSTAD